MWDIVWVSPQGHRSVSVSRHFLMQAPQCPCCVRKRFSIVRAMHKRRVVISKWLSHGYPTVDLMCLSNPCTAKKLRSADADSSGMTSDNFTKRYNFC